MILVTVGSQKFQFDRLLEKIDYLIAEKVIEKEVFAQTGYSDYRPKSYESRAFLNRDEFIRAIEKASIVITHGGTGVIIGAVKRKKKVIAVPRLEQYGEHVDDHQVQLITQFDEMDIIEACYDLEDLAECYKRIQENDYVSYTSNTKEIINSIVQYIEGKG
jgi:Uncharacterized conserved protein